VLKFSHTPVKLEELRKIHVEDREQETEFQTIFISTVEWNDVGMFAAVEQQERTFLIVKKCFASCFNQFLAFTETLPYYHHRLALRRVSFDAEDADM
jgi:hypothetical protein